MADKNWMLYGASGYTGELIAEEAKRRGLRPILAGRRAEAIRPLAERLGFEWRAFGLDSPDAIARELSGISAVLHTAGPFSATSRPMLDACMKVSAHYLDITGEIRIFEACHARTEEAKARGIVVMPGVGFDVVPSDCLAASLKEALPDATHLELAFAGQAGVSKGTAKTMVEGLGEGGAIRENGRIRAVPMGWKQQRIPFRDKPRDAMSIPWGDVSTAYHSTGIPNIVVYTPAGRMLTRALPLVRMMRPVLGMQPVQRFLLARVDARKDRGPNEQVRQTRRSQLWGKVTNAAGRSVEGTLVTPEGYALTVLTALECTSRVLKGGLRPGALTPSMAFGAGFIREIEGCDLRIG